MLRFPPSRAGLALTAALALTLLFGCGGGGDTPGATEGTLELTITAPGGVVADVEIAGPESSVSASASGPLDLAPGEYTITAHPVRTSGEVVDTVYVATGGTVTIAAGESAAFEVAYAQRPGSGRLWAPVWGSKKVNGYDEALLATGGDAVTPTVAVGLGASRSPYSAAVDSAGGLWLGTQGGEILRLAPAQLAASGTPTPEVELAAAMSDINGLAFDEEGDLWFSDGEGVHELAAAALTTSGDVTPSVSITTPAVYPSGIAFAEDGALWVALPNGNQVVRYAPAQLAASGEPEPSVTLMVAGQPRGIAFDAEGALWAALWSDSAVVKLAPDQITASGAPTPFLTLTGAGVNVLRLAFDEGGNLWVSSNYGPGFEGSGHVAKIAAANLVSSGTVAIDVGFANVGSFDSGGTLAFSPPPSSLPLAAAE